MLDNEYLIFLIFLALLNLSFFIFLKKLSKIINIYDMPIEERKIHKFPVPILGGLIIFTNIFTLILFGFFYDLDFLFNIFINTEIKGLIYFLIILILIFFIGLYDDKYKIRPLTRLISISILIYFMLKIDNTLLLTSIEFSFTDLQINFEIGKFVLPYVCLITLLIACNMSDGINLQSSIFYLINFLTLYVANPNYFILLIIFSLIIFSLLNFNGKIFLGDSGSYLLSILLGIYFIKYYNFNYFPKADYVFLFLLFPVLDASRCFFYRLIKGRSIFMPDNSHFHHILLKQVGYIKTLLIITCFYLVPLVGYLLEISSILTIVIVLTSYFSLLYKFKF